MLDCVKQRKQITTVLSPTSLTYLLWFLFFQAAQLKSAQLVFIQLNCIWFPHNWSVNMTLNVFLKDSKIKNIFFNSNPVWLLLHAKYMLKNIHFSVSYLSKSCSFPVKCKIFDVSEHHSPSCTHTETFTIWAHQHDTHIFRLNVTCIFRGYHERQRPPWRNAHKDA